jgi:hypothetical protein
MFYTNRTNKIVHCYAKLSINSLLAMRRLRDLNNNKIKLSTNSLLAMRRLRMSNIHNDTIKEKIYEQVLEDLAPLEEIYNYLDILSKEEFEKIVKTVTQHRWENHNG